jgi:hypothetical protein
MPYFEVTMSDCSTDKIEGANAYQQEGPMTTFFRCGEGREVIDSWSTRVASLRTNDIVSIHRRERSMSARSSRPLSLSA